MNLFQIALNGDSTFSLQLGYNFSQDCVAENAASYSSSTSSISLPFGNLN